MVVLAPLSSLTLPSGRAKPLVRGEADGDPAASTSLILPSGRTEPLVRGEGEPGGVASPTGEYSRSPVSWGFILVLSSRKGFLGEYRVVGSLFSPLAYCRIPRRWGGKD